MLSECFSIKLFKQVVADGASIIYVLPTATFQTNRKKPSAENRKNVLYCMPEQITESQNTFAS